MAQTTELTQKKCPTCKKPITEQEYENIMKLKDKESGEKFLEERKRIEAEHGHEIYEIQSEMEEIKKQYEEKEKQNKIREQRLENGWNESLKKMEEQNEIIHKQEIKTKDNEITQLRDAQAIVHQEAFNEANAKNQSVIEQKDLEIKKQQIMLENSQRALDEARKKTSQNQPNITGKAGEFNFKEKIMQKFPEDQFIEQNIGKPEGDLLQIIKVNGEALETPICYDNKVAKNVGKSERDKAKKYMKNHNTDHVIIVTQGIPKEVKNGLVGRVDGVLYVHPRCIVDVATS